MTLGCGKIIQSLHEACQHRPLQLNTIEKLLETMPMAAEFRGEDEWLPLHRVCRRQPSVKIVKSLIKAWPASVREWTNDGVMESRLPIHLACQYGASLSVVTYLAQVDPTCLQAVSPKQFYTALDFALYHYHQRRQQGLDVTEAERVVNFLAKARVQDRQDWEEKEKKDTPVLLPAVRACPVQGKVLATIQEKEEEKPHALPRTVPTKAFQAAYAPPRLPRQPVVPKSTSGKSKIIRIKLPRPTVPLR